MACGPSEGRQWLDQCSCSCNGGLVDSDLFWRESGSRCTSGLDGIEEESRIWRTHRFHLELLCPRMRGGCCVCAQSCPTLRNPEDHSPPGSSVHGFSQARILERVAISCFRVSSRPRDQTCVSCISATGRTLYHWEAQGRGGGAAITQNGKIKGSTRLSGERGRVPDILKSACKLYIKLLLTGFYS